MNLEPIHRGAPAKIQAVTDAERAALHETAYAVAQISGSGEPLEVLVDAMRQRLEALHDPTSPEGLAELKRQLLPMEALYLRFAEDAVTTKIPANRVLMLRAALQAQQGYSRTFALLHALTRQSQAPQGQAPVIELHEAP